MFSRFVGPAVVLGLIVSAAATSSVAARPNTAVAAHKLIVVVKKNLAPAAEKKLAVLVLINQNGGPPSAALATSSKALTVFSTIAASTVSRPRSTLRAEGPVPGVLRISGAANHKLEVVPSCRPKGSGFACSNVTIVKIY